MEETFLTKYCIPRNNPGLVQERFSTSKYTSWPKFVRVLLFFYKYSTNTQQQTQGSDQIIYQAFSNSHNTQLNFEFLIEKMYLQLYISTAFNIA